MIRLNAPLFDVYGIGEKFAAKFKNLGVATVKDLLFHFPFRYDDYSFVSPIADLSIGQQTTIRGIIRKVRVRRSFRKGIIIVEAVISDETGEIRAVWFNQPYIKNVLVEGNKFNFSGKVREAGGEIVLSSPAYEAADNKRITTHTARLVPVYPETKGITSKGIRFAMRSILENLGEVKEFIPEEILDENKLPEINESLRNIHFPKILKEAEIARRRFVFQELFLLSLYNLRKKVELTKEKALSIKSDFDFVKKAIEELPFIMTISQKKSLLEILRDIEKKTPMNRLLQGDVGSGKTVVVALAAVAAAKAGFQTAFMAPTEILARQHYKTIKKLFGKKEISVALIVGGNKGKVFFGENLETEVQKNDLKKKIASGEVFIIIGTHALIQKDVKFKKLGLVIVDEQHRFGVEQRAGLLSEGKQKNKQAVPHFLSMSATPIPRTLTLTVFGDLNLSVINEMPKGRKEIKTEIVLPTDREKTYKFIEKEAKAGRQVFVICPRIEIEEGKMVGQRELFKLEIKSVKDEYEKLAKKIFPDLKVGMLHGKIKQKEKEEVMEKFKEKKINILVATSVVEVGVDVPNATIMMIESAERFGLAQLYQFRGRVGRGEHQSYCFLFTESETEAAKKRLEAITTAKNGFELAEKDLALRGPGQFLGKKQTGTPDAAMKSLHDLSLIKEARGSAVKIIKESSELLKYPLLREKVQEFNKEVHME